VPTAVTIEWHVGVIVLWGLLGHPDTFVAYAQVTLGEKAERITEPVGLMLQHPKLELVFSGGEGRLVKPCEPEPESESELANVFYLR